MAKIKLQPEAHHKAVTLNYNFSSTYLYRLVQDFLAELRADRPIAIWRLKKVFCGKYQISTSTFWRLLLLLRDLGWVEISKRKGVKLKKVIKK